MPNLLQEVAHRPYAVQKGPWIMRQVWNDLLFAHWPVAPEKMRPLIPASLDLDTFDGQCWVGVVPFHMTNVRLRGFFPVPLTSRFAELNVRTYVVYKGRPGVYFFSLDAASVPAVWAARTFFHLPYFNAQMPFKVEGDTVTYGSTRTHRHAAPAELEATYGPTGPVQTAKPDSIEEWLTARYNLLTTDAHHRVYRGEIHHMAWPLQPAQADFKVNTMAEAAGITLPDSPPLLQFAKRLEVLIWPLSKIG